MHTYKMLCLDIDGTLLNSHHRITDITGESIRKISSGVHVILVSARMPSGMLYLLSELGLSTPVICYSGGLVVDISGNIMLNKIIDVSILKEIYKNFHDRIHFSLYQKDNWYVEKKDDWAQQEADITGTTPEIVDFNCIFSQMQEKNTGVNKVLCMGNSEQINGLEEKLSSYRDRLSIYRSKTTYLEIMEKSVSKTAAIKHIQRK